MFFWNSLAFSMIQWMLANWSLVPLPFLKPAWISGSSQFTYCWRLAWKILSITSLWNECNCAVVWVFFGIAFLRDWNENWPFPVLWPLLSFQICWHIECSTFTASSFRIWNSSTGIPSPPLALFIGMLSKAHLTHIPGCLALGEWSHHHGYVIQVIKIFIWVTLEPEQCRPGRHTLPWAGANPVVHTLRALPTHASDICLPCPPSPQHNWTNEPK